MAPYDINQERQEMLERLIEIPLRGFQEIAGDATPSTVVTSLPTPHEPTSALNDIIQAPLDTPPETPPFAFITNFEPRIRAPQAPAMKDFDSFTEGTAKGSFDSIPAGSHNEYGEAIYPISSLSLSLLPSQDPGSSIELWRAGVHDHDPNTQFEPFPPHEERVETDPVEPSSVQVKRPRSIESDDDQRRIRARAHIISTPTPSHHSILSINHRFSPSQMDTRLVPRRSRSAPPD